MTKQVHIHIHRTKARDAGEGEGKGKWITLSPSGTHVKVDGKGEITAGPKGMSGKKPSELSKKSGSTPAPGKNNEPSTQQMAKHVGKKVQPSKPGWALRADPELAAKFEAAEARSKAKKLERETGAGSLTKAQQARQFEEKASNLHQQAMAEYQKNGRSDEYARLKKEAQLATNQGTDLIVQAEAAARTSKPGPDGKPMGIHPALAAATPPGSPTPGSGKEPAAGAREKPQRNTVAGGLNASDLLRKAGTSKGEALGLYKVAADFLNHADSYQARGDSEKSAQFLKAAGDYYGYAQEAEKKAARMSGPQDIPLDTKRSDWKQR